LYKIYDKYHNPALFLCGIHKLFLCGKQRRVCTSALASALTLSTNQVFDTFGKMGGGGGKAFLQSKNLWSSAFKQFT
jgi:hypothetical protein